MVASKKRIELLYYIEDGNPLLILEMSVFCLFGADWIYSLWNSLIGSEVDEFEFGIHELHHTLLLIMLYLNGIDILDTQLSIKLKKFSSFISTLILDRINLMWP